MARPKKESVLSHTHHVNLRLTDTQYEVISESARRSNLTLSEYIRRQLLKGKVIAKYEIVADVNAKFNKNKNYNEVKSHHYIISFDPKDVTENGLTGERAQQLGLEFAKKNFPGHQALVCTHTDGHNQSGNIHVHIVINSLRKFDVEKQDFMERPCDSRAGFKHHQTRNYLIHLKQSVMEMCGRENLHQADLLTPAEKKITEREYHAKRTGQKKLNERNQQMLSGGITPRKTVYQTQKDDLRTAIDEAAAIAQNLEEFYLRVPAFTELQRNGRLMPISLFHAPAFVIAE